MKNIIVIVLFIFLSGTVFSQTVCPCCTEAHNQFDFWVGDWNVFDTTGTKIGENTIIKKENNCLLSESWRDMKGGSGSSYNYFNKSDSTWNQIWVDSNGNSLELKGNADKNKMILSSNKVKGTAVDWYINRITWINNGDGSVTQQWDILDLNNNVISKAFTGVYRKK